MIGLPNMDEQIQGAIERITYYNEENGYSVIKIIPGQALSLARRPGMEPSPSSGLCRTCRKANRRSSAAPGSMMTDMVYSFAPSKPYRSRRIPRKGVISYLSSGIVKGIGPRTAEKIVNHFGEKTVEILDTDPQRIHEVPELKTKLAENLIDAWTKNRSHAQLADLSARVGHQRQDIARRIINEYGAQHAARSSNIILISWRRMSSQLGFARLIRSPGTWA